MTPEEYLLAEEAALDKREYHAGEVLAMSGGNYTHSRIIANTVGGLGNGLRGSPCFVLESNMRVRLAAHDRYVYPDASIVCGEPVFDPVDKKQTTIINPTVVVEVLSTSTEGYDRGAKFGAYREVETLREYVLVSQDQTLVETFLRRPEGGWLFNFWRGRDAIASLRSVNVEVKLGDLYTGLTIE